MFVFTFVTLCDYPQTPYTPYGGVCPKIKTPKHILNENETILLVSIRKRAVYSITNSVIILLSIVHILLKMFGYFDVKLFINIEKNGWNFDK